MRALWDQRSIRAQLLLIVALIDVIALLLAGTVAVLRVRTQTRIEMAASLRLAEALVGDVVNLTRHELPVEQFLSELPAQLRSIRHVRITVKDAEGVPVAVTPSVESADAERASAPAVFAALVAPAIEFHELPVVADGRRIGAVEIVGEPSDEIAEFWENVVAVGVLVLLLNVVIIFTLYVLFGRVLDPLSALATGLSELGRQNYKVRLPKPRAVELSAITDHFNALASALQTLRSENLRLSRRLITAQDDERRRTALELHDEVGPCLFGLRANLSSIASAVSALPERDRLRDIHAIIDHLQAINRSMLERLRPMALGHVPLKELLDQLVRERARQHSEISFSCNAAALLRNYGDSIDLTVYRCVQEGISNAIRHAHARRIAVELSFADDATSLVLTVSDDGCGIHPGMIAGLGMRGMQERVTGLGGSYAVESKAGLGTCVRVSVPLADPPKITPETYGANCEPP
jgi:two-component system, NarL family, sensor histidine kinase UhpB